jgi:hypothetical protein
MLKSLCKTLVPSGPYKIETKQGTHIAKTTAKKKTTAASTNENIFKTNLECFTYRF